MQSARTQASWVYESFHGWLRISYENFNEFITVKP